MEEEVAQMILYSKPVGEDVIGIAAEDICQKTAFVVETA